MNILLLGSGGREHALSWKLTQSPKCSQLYILPGNVGTSACGLNINGSMNDFEFIKKVVLEKNIQMVIVGPEEPLVLGIHDFFLADNALKHIHIIGPRMQGAQLEGSKDFSKAFMNRHGIPTAAYASFNASELEKATKYINQHILPIVLKADGLAAGKGVVITSDRNEAISTVTKMLSGAAFGKAGTTVVIEQFLDGIELSVFVLTDGKSFKVFPEAKDYKKIGEGDSGLNTGGMGSVSPVPFATPEFMNKITEQIILPTIQGLQAENIPYSGFLFIGIIKVDNEPLVIEYNVRLGDPETESVLPRITSDLVELFESLALGKLDTAELSVSKEVAATIMLVAGGYPGKYNKGDKISGAQAQEGSFVFHAGTKNENGEVVTDGGRVLAVTAMGPDQQAALKTAVARINEISFEGMNFRSDIGFDL